jgi:hypothetical protein
MKDKHITGILNKYVGLRDIAIADLSVYLENPVGVGEHSDIGHEIERKIKFINEQDGVIECIQKYFGSNDTKVEDDDS